MKSKKMKMAICLTLSALMLSSLFVGCSKEKEDSKQTSTTFTEKKPEDYKGEITFWHFNKDEGPVIVENFKKKYPNVKVNYQTISDQNQGYQNKMASLIASGTGVPDVFVAESAFVKRFVNMDGAFDDLSKAPYNASDITKTMVPYTVDIGKDTKGEIRALSHQATPGAIGYKRDIAIKYFGTDDPDKISEMMSTPDKLLDMAKQLKEKSGGTVKFFSSQQELERVYLGSRDTGWVKDGKLVIDPKMDEFVSIAKTMRDGSMDAGILQWSQPWSAGIAKDDVFAYAIPTWGIPWIIECNDANRKDQGKWALAKAPYPYFWGGTWFGVSKTSKNKELAWLFVKFMTADKDNLAQWAKDRGDFINQTDLIPNMASDNANINKTLNQNVYKVYEPILKDIKGSIFTEYDDRIQAAYDDNLNSYLAGKISKDDFIKKFKEKVKSDFPDLKVE